MLAVLRDCGALAALLPEIDALFGLPQPVTHHPEVDVGVHVALALDYAAAHGVPLAVRYAVLTHDLGKAGSPAADWPKHHGHEARSVRLVERMSTRLRAPAECRDVARLVARWHGVIRSVAELRPTTLLEIFTAADALRRPERLDLLLAACECDSMSRPGADGEYAPANVLRSAFEVVRAVDVAAIARGVSAAQADAAGEAIASAIRAARIKALRAWRNARREAAGATSD
jgi:tRNA nucleotidyltransferase (CCA-adding enzyme)